MEPHPIPKNILEVEFQLFGSFTLKQFTKILFGSLFALLLFILPIPGLIKFPAMGISVLLGITLAISPTLGVKLVGLLKSILISPRYVWVKSAKPPELLTKNSQTDFEKRQNVSNSVSKSKVHLSEVSLDKLFSSKNATQNTQGNETGLDDEDKALLNDRQEVREENLDQLYDKIFSYSNKKRQLTKQNQNQKQRTEPQNSKKVNMHDKEALKKRIAQLKYQLTKVVKDQHHKEKEAEIMHEINELYAEFRALQQEEQTAAPHNQVVRNAQGKRVGDGQIVFGVIVDKKDNFIADARVHFTDIQTGEVTESISGEDGRFSTSEKLVNGVYKVSISHPERKFHEYKIQVGNQRLPAYKFRER